MVVSSLSVLLLIQLMLYRYFERSALCDLYRFGSAGWIKLSRKVVGQGLYLLHWCS